MSKIGLILFCLQPKGTQARIRMWVTWIGKSGDRGGKAGTREAGKIVWGQVQKSFEYLAKGLDFV